MRPLRVLHVAPHLKQGGAERMLASIAGRGSSEHHLGLMEASVFFREPPLRTHDLGFRLGSGLASLVRLPAGLSALRQLVAELRPDVVHGWIYYGCLLTLGLRRGGPPVVWGIHNSTFPGWRRNAKLRLVYAALGRASHRVPTRIVYCAESARRVHEGDGWAGERGLVVPNGVDPERFRPDPVARVAVRARLAFRDDEAAIGVFGRYDPQKNIPGTLDAFARFAAERPARLVLAGAGMEGQNRELGALLAARGLAGRTVLLGPVADPERWLPGLDAVLLGSTYGEALPMILIEALLSEAPIAATRVGDVETLPVPDEALARPGDPADLGRALGAAVGRAGEPAWRAAFSAARARYPLNASIARYEALYAELAEGGPA